MVCFLFFKQKTAYEMRISDWSSDVCSSDLAVQFKGAPDINRRLRQQTMGSVGPAGLLLADDTEMYERNHRGAGIRDPEWLVLTRGLHREREDENGYTIAHATDEVPQRGIWRHYLHLMQD